MVIWQISSICVLILTQICPTTSLPPAGSCLDRRQCPSGYYCSTSHYYCVQCTDCLAYNRVAGNECAQGIYECGDCFPGYVMGSKNPLGKCVEDPQGTPESSSNDGTPLYIWISLALILVVLFAVIAFFVKLIKNRGLNMNETAAITVSSPTPKTLIENSPQTNGSHPNPPHYGFAPVRNNTYIPLRPSSPEANPLHESFRQNLPKYNEYAEESNVVHVTSQKETELNQEAIGYQLPRYADIVDDEEDENEELLPQEEETAQSTWTHAPPAENDETSGPNFSNLVNEARHTILIRPPVYESDPDGPPRKIPRRQGDSGQDSSDGPSSASQRIPPIDQPPSLPALPTASTQGSNGIILRGENRIRHDTEECNNTRPTEINNNQNSGSSSNDTNNNSHDNSNSSGVGSSIPVTQLSNVIMNISIQQNM